MFDRTPHNFADFYLDSLFFINRISDIVEFNAFDRSTYHKYVQECWWNPKVKDDMLSWKQKIVHWKKIPDCFLYYITIYAAVTDDGYQWWRYLIVFLFASVIGMFYKHSRIKPYKSEIILIISFPYNILNSSPIIRLGALIALTAIFKSFNVLIAYIVALILYQLLDLIADSVVRKRTQRRYNRSFTTVEMIAFRTWYYKEATINSAGHYPKKDFQRKNYKIKFKALISDYIDYEKEHTTSLM